MHLKRINAAFSWESRESMLFTLTGTLGLQEFNLLLDEWSGLVRVARIRGILVDATAVEARVTPAELLLASGRAASAPKALRVWVASKERAPRAAVSVDIVTQAGMLWHLASNLDAGRALLRGLMHAEPAPDDAAWATAGSTGWTMI